MDWLTELFIGNSVAHTILVYAIVIAIGVMLGKVRFFGISLGATFVLFCGILVGHLGVTVDGSTLKFIQEFGLILFIFSIGLQVGPSFFSSFKHEGIQLNGIAMLIVALGIDNIPDIISQPLTMIGNITVPAALLIIGSAMPQPTRWVSSALSCRWYCSR